jgi:hypothetical protein
MEAKNLVKSHIYVNRSQQTRYKVPINYRPFATIKEGKKSPGPLRGFPVSAVQVKYQPNFNLLNTLHD